MTEKTTLPGLLGVDDVAGYLGVSSKHVYRLIADHRLKAVMIGQHWRLREQDLADYIDRLFTTAPEPRR